MTNRVVVTGLGSICGLGTGIAEYWAALCQGKTAIRPLTGFDDVKIKTGARVERFQPEQHFPKNVLPLLDRFSQFAVLAAQEAVDDAGLAGDKDVLEDATAIIGTGCGGKQTDEETYRQIYKENRSRVHPLTIPKGMTSAAASNVSKRVGIKVSFCPFTDHGNALLKRYFIIRA